MSGVMSTHVRGRVDADGSRASRALTLSPSASADPDGLSAWVTLSESIESAVWGHDIAATLAWCVEAGPRAADLDVRRTWELLASTAAADVTAARMLEPHLDALSIIAQARADGHLDSGELDDPSQFSWGVFAAEGPDATLVANPEGAGWVLDGTKPWCSLAADLSRALVTARVEDGRRLFAVDLRATGVRTHAGPWVARGLEEVVSAPVDFTRVPAVPVGPVGWYLARPGFAWGGIGVAAAWWGGAMPLLDPLRRTAEREGADQISLLHLGTADAALWAARAALNDAASIASDSSASAADAKLAAARTRSIVAEAVTRVLAELDAALGPLPLVTDEAHARRVADLHLYLRQDHGLRDLSRIGRLLAGSV